MLLSTSHLAADPADPTPDGRTPDGRSHEKIRFEHLTNRDGLSQMTIYSILQDRQGFMWFGTGEGLNRYDGYEFRIFKPDPDDPDSLRPGPILVLHEDSSGNLWIATWSHGLSRLDPAEGRVTHYRHDAGDSHSLSHDDVFCLTEDRSGVLWVGTRRGLDRFDPTLGQFIHYRHDPNDSHSLSHETVTAITEDRSGVLWVGTWAGGLNRLDGAASGRVTDRFTHYRHDPDDPHSLSHDTVRAIFEDHSGVLWIATRGGGLNRFDRHREQPAAGRFTHYRHNPDDPESLSHDMVRTIVEERSGVLWIATEGGGINRFDSASERFTHFRHDPRDPHSLSHDLPTSLYQDRSGTLWIGTRARGLDRFEPSGERFTHYRHDPDDPQGLSEENIFAITEDRFGALWIGTFGGGLSRFDRHLEQSSAKRVIHYRHDPDDPHSLSSNVVFAVYEDRSGNLWIGTESGLDRLPGRSATGGFTHYRHDPDDPHSLSQDRVRGIAQDRSGMLWIGTWGGGLNRLDPATGRFTRYRHDPDDPHSLGSDIALSILEDRSGMLWVGTFGGGLNRFDPARRHFTRYRHDPGNRRSLSHDNVSVLHEDSSGLLWIGTSGSGLNRFDPVTESFARFTEADGLSSNAVLGILEDDFGRLWISTSRGLTRFDPAARRWASYDVRDGLQDDEFSHGACFRGADGTMYFGGINGFNTFRPERFQDNPHVPPIALTSFKILERDADLGRAVPYLTEVELDYRQNFFSFEFAALSFTRPDKNRYAYMLEGLDADWIQAGTRRYTSYTSVPPGGYVFRVKGSNNDGLWNERGTSLRIVIKPPPWKTWWAYTLYAIALGAVISGYIRWNQQKVDRERAINLRLREIDRLKNEFLANTSHELRTPLHGITGLAESLLDGATGELPPATKANLAMIVASGRRLAGLVNDILDFTRMTHKSLELRRRPVDLAALIEVVLTVSRPLIGRKDLELRNAVRSDLPPADADENRLQQILLNLIGNAIKFTEAGTIEIAATVEADQLVVSVSDTGIGIEKESLDRIFEAFEQADTSTERAFGGTGLGLAVTRQLVQLHGGTIEVESTPGQGSTFSFTLPVSTGSCQTEEGPLSKKLIVRLQDNASSAIEPVVEDESRELLLAEGIAANKATRILIVDDEPINLQVLMNHLARQGFQLTQATSGPEAARLLAEQEFDLVLLDVMMPKMSGYEVCRTIRERLALHELPVIFLTAKNQVADLVTGLSVGGNDYLTKPIAKDELLARVRTQLELLLINRNMGNLIEERTAQMTERERLIAELQARNEELARFNYTISHDLKNPLVTIKNFLGVAKKDAALGDSRRLEQDLGQIDTAASKMQRLLEDLLELSRVGWVINPPVAVPLGQLAHEAAELVASAIAERGVELRIAPDMPVVYGDRARLVEMVLNLLDNAVKFMGDQEAPRVEVGSRRRENEEVFYIRDNGLGIEAPYHDKIFGLFERLTPEIDGTGVGLALVKRIVEMHGGRIWVESQGRGLGSTFCFTLPADGGEEIEDMERTSITDAP